LLGIKDVALCVTVFDLLFAVDYLLLTTGGDDFGRRRTEALGWNFYWFFGSDDGIIVGLGRCRGCWDNRISR
jgi:hypothetical protein